MKPKIQDYMPRKQTDEEYRNSDAFRGLQNNFIISDKSPRGEEVKFYIQRLCKLTGIYKNRIYSELVLYGLEHDERFSSFLPELRAEWEAQKDSQ